jgi:pimeloyl-ACP methyl ester carboxylesterase
MSVLSVSSRMMKARGPKALGFKIFVILTLILGVKLYINSALTQDQNTIDELKMKHPEKFRALASLSDGKTHYEFQSGLPSRTTVVMIHGVSGPMSTWDKTSEALNKDGFNTLRYDLYGRGFSSRVEKNYDLNLFVTQLEELLKTLQISGPLQIIGSSFGCLIASEFTSRNQERVSSIAMIGPAGFDTKTPFLAELRDVPLFGKLIFNLMGQHTIMEQNRHYFANEKYWFEFREFFKDQLEVKGSTTAILSTMLHSPVQNGVEIYAAIGKTNLAVLVLWGEQDKAFPMSFQKKLEELIPSQTFIPVADSGHLPHYERPEFVNSYLLSFLDKYDSSNQAKGDLSP